MKIAISGASGTVGSQLAAFLQAGGHEVHRIVRSKATGPRDVLWNPASRSIDSRALESLDAVVHLAGESIAARRWTTDVKARILESRTGSTKLLAGALARLERRPRVLVCASATGFYGDRGVWDPLESTCRHASLSIL